MFYITVNFEIFRTISVKLVVLIQVSLLRLLPRGLGMTFIC